MAGPKLDLLVLRCADLELTARFYSALGLDLVAEQHGNGPKHYSARVGETLLEFYPAGSVSGPLRLGFVVDDPLASAEAALAVAGRRLTSAAAEAVLLDPDGNRIHLAGALGKLHQAT